MPEYSLGQRVTVRSMSGPPMEAVVIEDRGGRVLVRDERGKRREVAAGKVRAIRSAPAASTLTRPVSSAQPKRMQPAFKAAPLRSAAYLAFAEAWRRIQAACESVDPFDQLCDGVEALLDDARRLAQRQVLSRTQCEAILEQIPERTRRTGSGGGNPARAFFVVMWETALRYSTLARISAPFDYRKGASSLRVRAEVDKARYARTLPLSQRARDALDSVCPDEGLIFGRRQYRHTLRKAALRAGFSEADARHIGYHEWRHAALMDLGASCTDLTAIAYIAGHKQVTTTAKYVRGRMEGAADALASRQAIGTSGGTSGRKKAGDP